MQGEIIDQNKNMTEKKAKKKCQAGGQKTTGENNYWLD